MTHPPTRSTASVLANAAFANVLPAAAASLAILWSCAADGPTPAARDSELTVFAAASLGNVARDLGTAFETAGGSSVVFNFAGSNTLAQQISDAGTADVFLSADAEWIRFLDERELTAPETLRPLFSNRLVIIAHRDSAVSIDQPQDLLRLDSRAFRHLAVADPRGVPAGRYARRELQRLAAPGDVSLWDAVAARLAPVVDVRAALALVESDPEILGIVYRTDAASSPDVRILYEFSAEQAHPIHYWGVRIAGSARSATASSFLDFLATPGAAEIARRHGFGPVSDDATMPRSAS